MADTISIFDAANWFLKKESMSDKKLQKLCYYMYAWGQALLRKQVFQDTIFQAWAHGPVSPELYHECKEYGWTNIPKDKFSNASSITNEDIKHLLESVWVTYGDKDANELEALTHREAPWILARAGAQSGERSNNPLSDSVVREFYQGIYNGD
ncbi:Panacea domain-containing protein [Lactiplantibacillus plantarum]|uniref:Panacea domain-containing protein n=1 Tax=Lactiplantibacillus plantarum TaxID=1590 RepID=UPI0009302508|nr:type II toxin-antitoxin system antitoxin SocA domain-containing protein [Lactiplantibacillus plantarum]MCB7465273.1 DUF4065 domain-containing protein [Lactiplantibacillus plantarum]MCB7468611.1 DUF4065 domain-containing protein [Lactiplantibacillus plantarum]MCB7472763.1 DUF4065 domain-containing protein [Lactiplantibacillus plantarum]MCB7475194.1 DUF4065 domain-containing protein [Lactiplantibacillus plantarum]MCB7478795.1 DUF4065 domain-containing protein [Lactiplantibacillus plantarum]